MDNVVQLFSEHESKNESKTCANCRYSKAREGDSRLLCVRYAPRPAQTHPKGGTSWPFVQRTDSCGEYEGKPDLPHEETLNSVRHH